MKMLYILHNIRNNVTQKTATGNQILTFGKLQAAYLASVNTE